MKQTLQQETHGCVFLLVSHTVTRTTAHGVRYTRVVRRFLLMGHMTNAISREMSRTVTRTEHASSTQVPTYESHE